MRDVGFAFVWCALLPMSLLSAPVGIALWIWVAMLSPNDLLYGFMADVPFNKVVALTTFMIIVGKRELKDLYLDTFMGAMILLLLVATLSWMTALVDSDDGTQLYLKFAKEVVLAVLITAVMGSRQRLFLILVTLAFSMGFYGLIEGLQFVATAGGHKILGTASVGDNNSLATAVLMIVPLITYLYSNSAVRIIRWGYMGLLMMCICCVVGTFSRGGFLGMIILGMFTVKNSKKRFRSLVLVFAAVILIVAVAPESWYERLSTINSAATDDTSFLGRVTAWKVSTLIAMDHPFLGGGPHAVQRYPVWNLYHPHIGVFDWFPSPVLSTLPVAAHSIWFEILGDLGFSGLALFVFLLCNGLWTCFKLNRLARRNPSITWAGDLARMLQTSLVVYATTASALSMGYFELFWIILAVISRLRRTAMQQLSAEREAAARSAPRGAGFPAPRPGLEVPIPRPALVGFDERRGLRS